MKPLIPYLFFSGNCRDAMSFYKQCFSGELELMTYGDSSDKTCDVEGAKDKIMHSCLRKDTFVLMASDLPDNDANQGNNVYLNIDCEAIAEIESLFKALTDGGKVVQPLSDTFWGARFGMLIDKYGIHWMLNCQLEK
jgi:PhnB protein